MFNKYFINVGKRGVFMYFKLVIRYGFFYKLFVSNKLYILNNKHHDIL